MKAFTIRNLFLSASAAALIAGGLAAEAQAQSAGAVTGTVRREGGTRNLAGADVRLVELDVTVQTREDGRFRLPNIAPGQYTLEISYLGEVLDSRSVSVDGDGTDVGVVLEPSSLEDVIVQGTRGALANARAQERSRDNLTSVVTADDIGQFADQNVAESLQRVPGLTIQRAEGEGRQVTIRGLSEGFVTVTVDGNRIGSRVDPTGGDTRAVNLDVFSSDLLRGIEVSKTLLPDQDADAIGGSVDLRSTSALDRGSDSLTVRGEYGYQAKSEDWNPKVSADFTRVFDLEGPRFGVAGGVSWQRRSSVVDSLRTDNGIRSTADGTAAEIVRIYNNTGGPGLVAGAPPPIYRPGVSTAFVDPGNCSTANQSYCILAGPDIYSPNVIDWRTAPIERERLSGNLNLELRLDDENEFFLRGSYAHYEDQDVRARQTWDIGPDVSLHEEIIELGPNSGIFADVDTEKRFRFSNQTDDLYAVSFGGEHVRGPWSFDYRLDYSSDESDTPSIEARFRERDIILAYQNLGRDGVTFQQYGNTVATGAANPPPGADPTNPAAFPMRFLTGYDFFSEDEIQSARFNLQRDITFNGRPAFFKFGGKYSERRRAVDVTRFRVNPPTVIPTLADFPNATYDSDFAFLFNPDLGALERFSRNLLATGTRLSVAENPSDEVISQARDYTASEQLVAGYAMVKLELRDDLEFFGGLRVEETAWSTAGFISNRVNYDEGGGGASVIIRNNLLAAGVTPAAILASSLGPRYALINNVLTPINETAIATPRRGTNDYTDIFANANLRWEPREDIVVRLSYTEGIQRPDFDEASANGEFQISETTDVAQLTGLTTIAQVENVVRFFGRAGTSAEPLRDPTLDPLRSRNYDLSVSYYPDDDLFFQAALFRKDIRDFIVRIISNRAQDFGFDPARFNVVETLINGEDAYVQGVEFTYSQNYTFLPGLLSGLFASANVTLADSEQNDGVSGRTVSFQEQADIVANVSVGWENDDVSLRWSGNYVDDRFRALNGGLIGLQFPAGDVYEQARFSMDINARWQVNDRYQVYLDATNINDAEERRYFQGGGQTGEIVERIENYGATYQIGLRARF